MSPSPAGSHMGTDGCCRQFPGQHRPRLRTLLLALRALHAHHLFSQKPQLRAHSVSLLSIAMPRIFFNWVQKLVDQAIYSVYPPLDGLMDFHLLYEGSLCLGFRLEGVLSPCLLLVIICGGSTI